VLGITKADPIRHNLLFERFLNPDRISMPDIDMDFEIDRREEVVDYVKTVYGEDKVARITTFSAMNCKGAIRDVGRAMALEYSEGDALARLLLMVQFKKI
jgi:DNA polymerase-3 subunit alpha